MGSDVVVIRNVGKHIENLKKAGYTECTEPYNKLLTPHEFHLTAMDAYEFRLTLSGRKVTTGLSKIESCIAFSIEAACESFRTDIERYIKKLGCVMYDAEVNMSDPFNRGDNELRFIVASVNSLDGRIVQELCIGEKNKIWAISSTSHEVEI